MATDVTPSATEPAGSATKTPRWARERFVAHPDRSLWLGGTLLALFALVGLFIPMGPLHVDQVWSEWMRDIATPAFEHVALVFNWLGRGIGRALTIAAVGLVVLVARRWLALLAYAIAESLAPLFSSVTKGLVDRPRPPGGLVHPSGASFPSGHATYAAVTCVALVLLFSAPGDRRRLWWGLAALGIAGMAWSRTYLQVHWLSDVAGGSMLGIGVALVVFAEVQHVAARRWRWTPP
jgi:undecaprenyl-diphosphatase